MTSFLRITEIFYSIQGESNSVGWPTVFIRLTGCPLRCQYCDTAYAFHGGKNFSLSEILDRVKEFNTRYITVTGGEPLAQPACLSLMEMLCDQNYIVSLETSGALDVSKVDSRVIRVIDLKAPGSSEVHRNLWSNISWLKSNDQIKFVISNHQDYLWSKEILNQYHLSDICTVLFSPSFGQVENQQLAEWILKDQLPVRFQTQLHKVIWGDIPGK